jgi:hypothetical protein
MAEGIVQVAPDSTGKKMRTRERTIGANLVEEQYVVVQPEAVAINRVWMSTQRIPSRALAALGTQPLFSIWNGIAVAAGASNISVRRFSVEIDSVAVQTVASPQLRLFRTTAAAANGTVVAGGQQYTSDPALNALVVARGDYQSDTVAATTALTQASLGTAPMWSQTVPRMVTAAGFQVATEYNLLPNDANLMAQDPLILRPQEGCHVQLVAGGAVTAGQFTFTFKVALAEFTYP